jgi:hypothetical protein
MPEQPAQNGGLGAFLAAAGKEISNFGKGVGRTLDPNAFQSQKIHALRDIANAERDPTLLDNPEFMEDFRFNLGRNARATEIAIRNSPASKAAQLQATFIEALTRPIPQIDPAGFTSSPEGFQPTPSSTPLPAGAGLVAGPGSKTAMGGRFSTVPFESLPADKRVETVSSRLNDFAQQPGGALGLSVQSEQGVSLGALALQAMESGKPQVFKNVPVDDAGNVASGFIQRDENGQPFFNIQQVGKRPSLVTINNQPSPTTLEEITKTRTRMNRLKGLLKVLDTPGTRQEVGKVVGPRFTGMLTNLQQSRFFGGEGIPGLRDPLTDPQAEFLTEVAQYRDTVLSERGGAVIPDAEYARLVQSLPDFGQGIPLMRARLKASLDILRDLEKTRGIVLTEVGFVAPTGVAPTGVAPTGVAPKAQPSPPDPNSPEGGGPEPAAPAPAAASALQGLSSDQIRTLTPEQVGSLSLDDQVKVFRIQQGLDP